MENPLLPNDKSENPFDPEFFKGCNRFCGGALFKKCCKKYKKGKRCKDCPGKKK